MSSRSTSGSGGGDVADAGTACKSGISMLGMSMPFTASANCGSNRIAFPPVIVRRSRITGMPWSRKLEPNTSGI